MNKNNDVLDIDIELIKHNIKLKGWTELGKASGNPTGQSFGFLVKNESQRGYLRCLKFKAKWFNQNGTVKNEFQSKYKNDVIRYQREIKKIPQLNCENIFSILDSGEVPDKHIYWYISELGEALDERWKKEFLVKKTGDELFEEALKVCRDVLNGLKVAHENDIIHRDIKPKNIIYRDGHYEIIDWGIAKFFDLESITDNKPMNRGYAPQIMRWTDTNELKEWVDIYMVAQILIWLLKRREPGENSDAPIHWDWVPYQESIPVEELFKVRVFTAICAEVYTCPENGKKGLEKFNKIFTLKKKNNEINNNFGELESFLNDLQPKYEGEIASNLRRFQQASPFIEQFFFKWEGEITPYINKIKKVVENSDFHSTISISSDSFEKYHSMVKNGINNNVDSQVTTFKIDIKTKRKMHSFGMSINFFSKEMISEMRNNQTLSNGETIMSFIEPKEDLQLFGRLSYAVNTDVRELENLKGSYHYIVFIDKVIGIQKHNFDLTPDSFTEFIINKLFSIDNLKLMLSH